MRKKSITAICHGAQLLAAAGMIQGKRVSCYPACAPEVQSAGGIYAKIGVAEAIVDAMLVTAPAHPAWLSKYIEVLNRYLAQTA